MIDQMISKDTGCSAMLKQFKAKFNILIEEMFITHFEDINAIKLRHEKALETKETLIKSLQSDLENYKEADLFKKHELGPQMNLSQRQAQFN